MRRMNLFAIACIVMHTAQGQNPHDRRDYQRASRIKASDAETEELNYVKDPYQTQTSGYDWPPPSKSLLGVFKKAAIVTDNGICSDIARDVLVKGGNAVDAGIAAVICVGVTNFESNGIGGGFLMTIYNRTTRKCSVIDARETAPALAVNKGVYTNTNWSSMIGASSVGVPGEIAGHWLAYSKYGSRSVPWKDLIMPSAELLKTGFPVSNYTMVAFDDQKTTLLNNTEMRLFLSPGGKLIEEGEMFKNDKLANFMEELANAADPTFTFYKNDSYNDAMNSIMEGEHGFLRSLDFDKYKPLEYEGNDVPKNEFFHENWVMCGPPLPSSFAVTQAIIAIMFNMYDGHKLYPSQLKKRSQFYHRMLEAQKFAYAHRTFLGHMYKTNTSVNATYSRLLSEDFINEAARRILDNKDKASTNRTFYTLEGEPNASKEGHGTSHVSVVDQHGNAVSITSSINLWFGSQRVDKHRGFIWNDQMDDFTTSDRPNDFGFPPNDANEVKKGERPMSSMSPTVIYDQETGQVIAAAGATGGSKIIASLANALTRALLFGENIKQAIDAPYIYNKFFDDAMTSEYEANFPTYLHKTLEKRHGQKVQQAEKMKSTVQAIVRGKDGYLYANSDARRTVHMYPTGF